MTRWLISVPVYGERYVDEFIVTTLPALQRAIKALVSARGVDVRLVVHTDQPDRIRGACQVHGGPQPGFVVECRPVPAGTTGLDCLSQAHREVLNNGMLGDVVVLLTAGAVISQAGLKYCADVLDNPGLRVVLSAAPRVLSQGILPDTVDAAAFMRWGWNNRHPLTNECTWPDGKSQDLSRSFFVSGDTVVTRMTLPHPLAVRIDGRILRFSPTVDANLNLCFDPSEMHIPQDCSQLALIKLTPLDKAYDLVGQTIEARAANQSILISNGHQRWCLSHRLLLCGPGASPKVCGDAQFVGSIQGG